MIFPGPQKITSLIPIAKPWSTWSPTITATSGSLTTVTVNQARYRQLGNYVNFYLRFTIVTNGTGAGALNFTTPPGFSNIRAAIIFGRNESSLVMLQGIGAASSFNVVNFNGTYPGADSRSFSLRGQYRV